MLTKQEFGLHRIDKCVEPKHKATGSVNSKKIVNAKLSKIVLFLVCLLLSYGIQAQDTENDCGPSIYPWAKKSFTSHSGVIQYNGCDIGYDLCACMFCASEPEDSCACLWTYSHCINIRSLYLMDTNCMSDFDFIVNYNNIVYDNMPKIISQIVDTDCLYDCIDSLPGGGRHGLLRICHVGCITEPFKICNSSVPAFFGSSKLHQFPVGKQVTACRNGENHYEDLCADGNVWWQFCSKDGALSIYEGGERPGPVNYDPERSSCLDTLLVMKPSTCRDHFPYVRAKCYTICK